MAFNHIIKLLGVPRLCFFSVKSHVGTLFYKKIPFHGWEIQLIWTIPLITQWYCKLKNLDHKVYFFQPKFWSFLWPTTQQINLNSFFVQILSRNVDLIKRKDIRFVFIWSSLITSALSFRFVCEIQLFSFKVVSHLSLRNHHLVTQRGTKLNSYQNYSQ